VAAIFGGIATVLGAILSPLGLVAAGVVGLGVYFTRASGAAGKAMQWIKDKAQDMGAWVSRVFDGVRNAMAAGDMQLAAAVLWAAIKVQWVKGLNFLKGAWFGFRSFWLDGVSGIAMGFVNAMAAVKTAWIGTIAFIKDAWARFKNSNWTKAYASFFAATIAVATGQDVDEVLRTLAEDFKRKDKALPGELKAIEDDERKQKADVERRRKGAHDALTEDVSVTPWG